MTQPKWTQHGLTIYAGDECVAAVFNRDTPEIYDSPMFKNMGEKEFNCDYATASDRARLIAAAPALFEALERLTRIAAVEYEKSRPDVIEQARAALKAAGWEP